ncbi:signal recognition particle-docking protein FtsY [Octadecabacter sp.]|nr:signal recognition particle-docking protein FtsY [Octadecabacter sp.]
MAFFKKLKDRLFKSSSKIEDGLDAIVGDGGVEEAIEPQIDTAAQEAAQTQAANDQALKDEEACEAARAAQAADDAEQDRIVQAAAREEQARREAEKAQADRVLAEAAAAKAAQAKAEAEVQAKAQAAQDAAEDAAQRARLQQEEADRADAARAAEAERAAKAAQIEQAQRQAAVEKAARDAERAKQERVAKDTAAAQDAQQRHEAQLAQVARAEAEAAAERAAEDVRLAEAQKAEAAAAKPGLLGRLLGRGEKKTVVRRELDDDMLEQLEELLISADMGVDTALRVTANMAEGRFGKRLSTAEIKELLAAEVTRIMEPVARPMPLYPTKPQVVLVVGVNGSGKTTTIGKLASQFQTAGKKVVIAAGDTFRAAAVEQLQVWGERAGVPVLTAPEGSDPASLAFDAMEQAGRDGADLLMIDTAGRLQNRADLMEELSKIVRVIRKKDPDAPHNTLLVLDATTGQNALSQVKAFQELADVSGLVMTKLDGTAKGGVLVALADKFGLPIHAIGVGEQIDDLAPFDPEEFADALIGIDR